MELGAQISSRKLEILAERSHNEKAPVPAKAIAKKPRQNLSDSKKNAGNLELATTGTQYEN